MSVIDVIFKILAAGNAPSEYGEKGLFVAVIASMILSLYIFFCYRIAGRRTFYSMSYNLCLLGAGPVTAALVFLMHQNAIASIGVVGALSIVRLRGAVKEPMDLVFLLWSVASGIFVASGRWRIGIIASILITAMVILVDLLPFGRAPLILSIYGRKGEKTDLKNLCSKTLARYCGRVKRISAGAVDGKANLVLRVRTRERDSLVDELSKIPGVGSVTLLEQSSEVNF